MKIGAVEVSIGEKAVFWKSGMAIDADGAHNAYAPPPKKGLDLLGNAGYAGNWWGIACDSHGTPYIQGADDPCPGMYVSVTALQDKNKPISDPARYVDSATIPYMAVPPELLRYGVTKGDLGMAYNTANAKTCYFIVGDVGPRGKIGEGSIALADGLGIPSSPRKGGCRAGVCFVIFTKTSRGWPCEPRDMNQTAETQFRNWGGIGRFGST